VSEAGGGFVGNDVVDLASPLLDVRAAEDDGTRREWIARHLTETERSSVLEGARFWEIFASKEAASKAFEQAGVAVPRGAFRDLEVDLCRRRVTHGPTGSEAEIALLEQNADRIHAVVVFPADHGCEGLAARVERAASDADSSQAAREALARLLADAAPRRGPAERYAVASRDGRPRVLEAGTWRDWSVSLSHSGRFVAVSALLP